MTLPALRALPLTVLGSLWAVLSLTGCKTNNAVQASTAKDVVAAATPPAMTFNTCGQANTTTICLASDRKLLQVSDGGKTLQVPVTSAEPSTHLSGGTAYLGAADLSFIPDFGPSTQIALITQLGKSQGMLMYLSTSGWVNWPNSSLFRLFDPTRK